MTYSKDEVENINRIFYRVCRIIGDGLPYPLTYHRTFAEAQKAAMERILEVER